MSAASVKSQTWMCYCWYKYVWVYSKTFGSDSGKSHFVVWPWCLQPVWKARLWCVTFISMCGCSQKHWPCSFSLRGKSCNTMSLVCVFMGQSWLMFWCWLVLSVPHSPALVSACVVAGYIPPTHPAPPHFVSLVSITDICMGCLLFQVQVYFFSISQPLL